MKILIACEYSGIVRDAFLEKGHDAISCDILPTESKPERHYQGDVMDIINDGWDKVISFPPCTDITVSGARWFEGKRNDGSQEKSIRFFFEIWKKSNCCENPIGIINGGGYIEKWFPKLHSEMKGSGFPFKPSQIIQPWQFGHGETKATCLWLNGLPLLTPTNVVNGREQRIFNLPPSPDRAKIRSRTFQGIANAMADQWG